MTSGIPLSLKIDNKENSSLFSPKNPTSNEYSDLGKFQLCQNHDNWKPSKYLKFKLEPI